MKKKRFLSLILAAVIIAALPVYHFSAQVLDEPVLSYTFEDAMSSPALFGNASLVYDEDKRGNVLSLDGSSGTYAEITQGFFDGMDEMTIVFDIYQRTNYGNYFTFCIGQNNTVYDYFRIRDNEIRNAITQASYMNENEVRTVDESINGWMNIALVWNNTQMQLYVNGELVSTNGSTGMTISDMGSGLYSFFGKSLYDDDGYYNGLFDNFEVYDKVLSGSTINRIAEDRIPTQPILRYTFEDGTTLPTLNGNAATADDEDKESKVLVLDGSSGTYAEIPQGTLNGCDKATILFDVKNNSSSGNFFTFAFGTDSNSYDFFRIRGSEVRNAITVNSYMNEHEVKKSVDFTDSWMSVAIVFDDYEMSLYINGTLAAVNGNTGIKISDLGSDLKIYLGKSFYDGDGYFSGGFDNFEIYDSVLDSDIIKEKAMLHLPLLISASVGYVVSNLDGISGTDSHTAVRTVIDRAQQIINPTVQRRQSVKAVPVSFYVLNEDCTILVDNEVYNNDGVLDLSYDRNVKIICGDTTEEYTLEAAQTAANPVLPGMYADPDIDLLDGKFWIYPTTDGVPGWGGTQFHAFSSRDMVHWTDEGVILDNYNKSPGTNDKGVQIASCKWSNGNAWAPAIEEKNGKYYFYFCGRILSEYESLYGEGMAIGVAVADSPAGPYTASDTPIVYPKMVSDANFSFSGQVIDPAVYTEGSTSYLLFGNGSAAIVTLNSDMMSVNTSTFHLYTDLTDFRESIAVFKREGYYYFTWSCDDTGSENYHINYGTASSLTGKITNRGTLLAKDTSNGILATGHQSVLYMSDCDRCFIAYHRFYTPLSIGGNVGHHRETCIDEITFENRILSADLLNTVIPSMSGTGPIDVNGNNLTEVITHPTCTDDGSIYVDGSYYMGADEAHELAAFGHSYIGINHPASCTEDGYCEHRCTLCDYSFNDSVVPMTGHDISFYRTGDSNQLRIVCTNGDIDRTFVFADYINKKRGDEGYDELLDVNGDGIINAKDFAIINLEAKREG